MPGFQPLPPLSPRPDRLNWYEQSRFGMSLHYGLYSMIGENEWYRAIKRLSAQQYQPYFDAFRPEPGCCREWARLAREAGAKYMVLTTKHHDGFCLWNTRLTPFNVTRSPAQRDLLREYVDALRAEGIRVGFYYSLVDWNHPDYGPVFGDRQHPLRHDPAQAALDAKRDWSRYVRFLHGQVEELMTHYGQIDVLYFDFSYWQFTDEHWGATELMAMVRRLQPGIVVNDRLGFEPLKRDVIPPFAGDFDHAEQNIPRGFVLNARGERLPFEAWFTINNSWCYSSTDRDFKSPESVIRALVNCVSKGGNLSLNAGPDAAGRIDSDTAERFRAVGRWLTVNGESIRGCGPAGLDKPEWGRWTRSEDGARLYAHVLEPVIGHICLPGLRGWVREPVILSTGEKGVLSDYWNPGVQTFDDHDDLFLNTRLPVQCTHPRPDPVDTVVRLEVVGSQTDHDQLIKTQDHAKAKSMLRVPFD